MMAILFMPSRNADASEVAGLGPVMLGMNISEVRQVLGKPRFVKTLSGFLRTELTYSGLSVQFDEGDLVAGVESTSSRYCFDEWLCPGMAYSSAQAAGMSHGARYRDGQLEIYGDGCWISAAPHAGNIKRVRLSCEP